MTRSPGTFVKDFYLWDIWDFLRKVISLRIFYGISRGKYFSKNFPRKISKIPYFLGVNLLNATKN
jgi:hypothetical protein